VNRPKTGYDLVDGELVPNEMAPVVRRIFTTRGEGGSQGKIAESTGVKYSTVLSILGSRIYLGEVQMNGEWFAGHHEGIITPKAFAAAHRGRVRGRARGTDLLSGRVRCGLCQRLMALDQNGEGLACLWRSVRHSVRLTMHWSRWRAVTIWPSTSMPWHSCSQRSTSTKHGRPRRKSNGVC
jgi:hypothetical protein